MTEPAETQDFFNGSDSRCQRCSGLTDERKRAELNGPEYRQILSRQKRLQSPCPKNCDRRVDVIFFSLDRLKMLIRGDYRGPNLNSALAISSEIAAFHSHTQ